MRCFRWCLVTLAVNVALHLAGATAAPAPTAGSLSVPTLRWNNGETLAGQIVGGSPSELLWKSSLFEKPVALRWSVLRRVDCNVPAAVNEEPWAVRLRDGGMVLGDVVGVDADRVLIQSARHGDVSLKRSEVLGAFRLRAGRVLFAGPVGDRGWKLTSTGNQNARLKPNPNSAQLLEQGPGGALVMPYWNTSASLPLPLPEKVEVEFRLSSTVRPDFSVALVADSAHQIRLETWDNELVLNAGNHFKRLLTLDEKDRVVALRTRWNRITRELVVCTPEGEVKARWTPAESAPAKPVDSAPKEAIPVRKTPAKKPDAVIEPGIVIANKGRDMALQYLRVTTWGEAEPSGLRSSHPSVETTDGRIVPGVVVSLADGTLTLRKDDGTEETIPMSETQELVISADTPSPMEKEIKAVFSDGTVLYGSPVAIADGRLLIDAQSSAGISSSLEGLRQLLIRVPPAADAPRDRPLQELDKLKMGDATIHGLVAGSGEARPKWRMVGSSAPATPSKAEAAEITRAIPAGTVIEPSPALFHIEGGDVIPGRLRGIDPKGVDVESSVIEAKRLAAETLNAIQFGAATHAKFDGFLDPGWTVLKGNEETVKRTKDTLRMEADTSIGHASALFANEIKFSFKSTSFACLRLRLFCEGTDSSKCPNLMLMHMGSRITAGIENGEGQFDMENQVGVASGKPVRVKLLIGEKQVSLTVNGYQVQKYTIDPARRAGAGLVLEPASMWGNSVQPVELAEFSANSELGKTWLPDIPADAKARALTVPRFRKEDAPRHALLAANGDLLRGEIEALTGKHFGFRSGLENLQVPRDRVKAAIWLKKPSSDVAPAISPNKVSERLAQRISSRSRYGGASLSTLIDFLKRQDPELKFKLPAQRDNRSFEMSFGGQSIGDALEEICSMFDVHYRIDDDGTIVIEQGKPAKSALVRRVYWMKESVFKAATVREDLQAKGITFPAGALVSWEPAVRQLLVINTTENHEKLLKVIESSYGGIAGSATHWLALTNGARLAMAVDRFDEDAVSGHHPLYGQCRVRFADIATIRTSPPDITETDRAVSNWHLVHAPEPVLPETPGESSPLLGKPAKPFKLPLLSGGEFDLAKEQGNVVILDFWATWCGPCIKSLPGLIEAISKVGSEKVKLIGLNQGEPPEQVKRFLETRRWALTVAMDSSQTVGQSYGVDGIPFTVIIAPDGKVAWVHTGYTPDGEQEVVKVVQQLLGQAPQ